MKRRTFLIRGMSATASAFAPLARTRAARASVRSTQSRSFDIAVVGAGMFGSAAARHLSADADGIALIGPDEPPRRRTHQGVFASHYDATRLVRIADPDLIWATLAKRSIGRFRAIERASGISFYREIGYMMVTPGALGTDWFDFPAMRAVADDLDVTLDELTGADLETRFPALRFTPGSGALLQSRDAGMIDPRKLVQAQQTLARAQGTTIIRAEVGDIRRVGDQIEIRAASGEAFRANRVLVATGASTNACDLLGRPLDITVRAAMTMQAEVSPETRLAIPTILYAKTDGVAPFWGLLMPPVTYPDGRRYVKTMDDHYGSRALESYDDLGEWNRGAGHRDHAHVLQRALREVAPSLDIRSTRFTPCPIADTATSYPYVDLVTDRLGVVMGGNGKAAKSSDEIGRLGAALIQTGTWPTSLPRALFAAKFVGGDSWPRQD